MESIVTISDNVGLVSCMPANKKSNVRLQYLTVYAYFHSTSITYVQCIYIYIYSQNLVTRVKFSYMRCLCIEKVICVTVLAKTVKFTRKVFHKPSYNKIQRYKISIFYRDVRRILTEIHSGVKC